MVCNWGILGPGFVATRAMIPAIQRSSNGRVRAIASRDRARAQDIAARYNVERAYGAYQDVLDDPAIDAVYIALPNHLHLPWTIQAARAGKHVLCEKPLACQAQEAEHMLAVCQAAQVQLMEAAMYRFHPRMRTLQQMVSQEEPGRLHFLHSAFSFPLRDEQNYRNVPTQGGGALLDVGYYCVNALCWLNQAEPVEVQAFTRYREQGGIDLETSALLRFADGLTGHIQCSFAACEHQVLELVGSKGALSLPHAFTAWKDDPTTLHIQKGFTVTEQHFAPADPYQLLAEHFVEVIQGQAVSLYPAHEAIRSLRVLDTLRGVAPHTQDV